MSRPTPGLDPLHASCVQTLSRWPAPTGEQERLRLLFLDHLVSHPDGWARSCADAHLTASSLICATAQQRVLLTLHARIGRWLQTGGHIEAEDGSLPRAALREATEESGLAGLQIDENPLLLSRHLVSCGALGPTFHLDVQYLVQVSSPLPPSFGAESRDVQWFAPDALPGVDPSVLALVGAAADRLGW